MNKLIILFASCLLLASTPARSEDTQAAPLQIQVINTGPLSLNANMTLIKGKDSMVLVDVPFTRADTHRLIADILETGNTVAFCGHVGPPLDSLVDVTITAPDGGTHTRSVHANKIGWMYDPSFDFIAEQPGRWTVDVRVTHDRPYAGNGVTPTSHNTGTVLGTSGRYEFYVVEPEAPGLFISTPQDGFLTWPAGNVEAVPVRGSIPLGTAAVYYTIYDKGIVMEQGALAPGPIDTFNLVYDPVALNEDFPMLSLTAHEGRWEGLADEVTISLLAVGDMPPRAAKVTLIGEEVFVINDPNAQTQHQFIPRAGR